MVLRHTSHSEGPGPHGSELSPLSQDAPSTPRMTGLVLPGGYALSELLGRGGMGEVYAAVHQPTGRAVAVKVLRSEALSRTDRIRRFAREARMVALLQHPHIVSVLDSGTSALGEPFLVMERLEGVPLSALSLPLPPARAATIAMQVLGALECAHAAGVVHRDVKAANVMRLSGAGIYGDFVKVLDFGLAAQMDSDATDSLTRSGQLMGTPTCTSPEVIAGLSATPASDLYALGVVLFQLLTGAPPFLGPGGVVIAQHLDAPAPRVSSRALVSARLDRLVAELLAKDPLARPPHTHIRQVLSDEVNSTPGRLETPARGAPPTADEPTSSAEIHTSATLRASSSNRSRGLVAVATAALLGGAVGFFAARLPAAAAPVAEPTVAVFEPAAIEPPAPMLGPDPRAAEGSAARERADLATHIGVAVTSTPSGAAVFEGGHLLGATPLELPTSPGLSRTLLLVHPSGGVTTATIGETAPRRVEAKFTRARERGGEPGRGALLPRPQQEFGGRDVAPPSQPRGPSAPATGFVPLSPTQ